MDVQGVKVYKEQVMQMTVSQLKGILKEKGVSTFGAKKALQDRVIECTLRTANGAGNVANKGDSKATAKVVEQPMEVEQWAVKSEFTEDDCKDNIEETRKDVKKPNKRKAEASDDQIQKKAKPELTPLAAFYELRPAKEIEVSFEADDNKPPTFTCVLKDGERKYEAKGNSKKLAKQNAAVIALRTLAQLELPDIRDPKNHLRSPTLLQLQTPAAPKVDFTSDDIVKAVPPPPAVLDVKPVIKTANGAPVEKKTKMEKNLEKKAKAICEIPQVKVKLTKLEKRLKEIAEMGEAQQKINPIGLLNELMHGLVYTTTDNKDVVPKPNKRFSTEVEVNGKVYSGTGVAKQESKQSAALAVLKELFKIQIKAPVPQRKLRAMYVKEQKEVSNGTAPPKLQSEVEVDGNGNWTLESSRQRLNQFCTVNNLPTVDVKITEEGEGVTKVYTASVSFKVTAPAMKEKEVTAAANGPSKKVATQSCCLQLVSQLFKMGLIEAFIPAYMRPKKRSANEEGWIRKKFGGTKKKEDAVMADATVKA